MRREVLAVWIVAVLLGAAWAGWQVLFPDSARGGVLIVEVQGSVQHAGREGTVPAAVGQQVHASDRLVAGPDGRAVLAFGTDSRLTLDQSSAIEVVAVDDDGVKVELDGGRVSATVRPGGRRLAVAAGNREITARDADFTVGRGADGTLAVSTERGSVTTNLPGIPTVGAGQKLIAPRDRQALVAPTSEDLLLVVAWPEMARTRSESVLVAGTTEPGARVTLDGAGGAVTVDSAPDGGFEARLRLLEGQNEVRVHATSALGQVAEVTWKVVRDTEAPPISVELHP